MHKRSEREDGPLDVLLRKYGVEPFVDAQLANVDETTARDLRELRARKLAAVRSEDFEYASQLKRADEQLQQLGAEILRLDNERIAAIACEEYDEAKALRVRLTWLQRDAARRNALAIAASGDPTPVSLQPPEGPDGEGADAELLLASNFTPADAALAEPLVGAFGARIATAAFSDHWRARTAALGHIAAAFDEALVPPPSALLARTLAVPIARALAAAPVPPHAVAAAAAAVRALASAGAASGDAADELVAAPHMLGALVARAADSNATTREAVRAACVALVEHPMLDAPLALPTVHALCDPPRASQPWRCSALSLQLLRIVVWRCQPADGAAPPELPIDALVGTISEGLRHAHADVRAAAIDAAAALSLLSVGAFARIRERAPLSLAQPLAEACDLAARSAMAQRARTLDAADTSVGGVGGGGSVLTSPREASLSRPTSGHAAVPQLEPGAADEAARRGRAATAIQSRVRGQTVRRFGGPMAILAHREAPVQEPLALAQRDTTQQGA